MFSHKKRHMKDQAVYIKPQDPIDQKMVEGLN
jgi:hypothetical protein